MCKINFSGNFSKYIFFLHDVGKRELNKSPEKTLQIKFSRQNFTIENNYSILILIHVGKVNFLFHKK